MPVKLVTVETDGQVREVEDSITCSSTDVDVVKVFISLITIKCLHSYAEKISYVIVKADRFEVSLTERSETNVPQCC